MVMVIPNPSSPLTGPQSPSIPHPPSVLTRFLPTLTTTSHLSALLFSSFLVLHLGAPVASTLKIGTNIIAQCRPFGISDTLINATSPTPAFALSALTLGCTEAASKWQFLGRVFYQGTFSEPLIVWGAALAHIASSLLKRGLLLYLASQARRRQRQQQKQQSEQADAPEASPAAEGVTRDAPSTEDHGLLPSTVSTSKQAPRSSLPFWPFPLSTPTNHALSAYLLSPLLLSHVLLHRIRPLSPCYPIHSLSPSELDYSFVHLGTRVYPILYGTSLVALTTIAAYHVAGGMDLIARRATWKMKWKRNSVSKNRGRKKRGEAEGEGEGKAEAEDTSRMSSSSSGKRSTATRRGPILPSAVASILVLIGLWGIAADSEAGDQLFITTSSSTFIQDPTSNKSTTLTWLGKRTDAVYNSLWPYSLCST